MSLLSKLKEAAGVAVHDVAATGHAVGNVATGVAKGAVSVPAYFAKTDIINPSRQIAAQLTGNRAAYNSVEAQQRQLATPRQFASNTAQLGLSAIAPGAGKLISSGVERTVGAVAPKLITSAVSGAATGAAVGAPLSVASAEGSGNVPLRSIPKIALQGAGTGAVLGGAAPVVAAALPVAARGAATLSNNIAKGAQSLDNRAFTPVNQRIPLEAQNALKTVSDYVHRVPGVQGSDYSAAVRVAQPIADRYGVNLNTGTTADRQSSINQILDQIGREHQAVSQGGYIRNPLSARGVVEDGPLKQSRAQPAEIPKTVPTEIARKQTVLSDKQESLGVPLSTQSTPIDASRQFNPNDYVRQQTKLQESARKQGTPSKFEQFRQEFKEKLVDSMAPVEDTFNKAVKNGAQIAPENNIKYQIDRALRADTIGAQYIKDNGLAQVIQDVPNTNAFDQYLIAKHAKDLAKNGVETGRNRTADKKLIEQLAPVYEKHAQTLTQYNRNLLDHAVNYGLVSKETAAALKNKYPNYVPANRIFGEDEVTQFKGNGAGKASISTQSVVQKIKGSKRQIESPLASIIGKTQDVIKEGERNKAASILSSYKDLPGNPFALRELGPTESIGTKPTISFLDNGKVRKFETTPEIANAAKSLNPVQLGLLGKIFSYPTRLLRLGATSLNPAFAGANAVKDLASGVINSKHPVNSIANPHVFLDALKTVFNHNSEQYGELVRQGAGGTSFDIARDAPRQNVALIRAQKNAPSKVLYTVSHPSQLFRAAENAIGRSEEFTRALQYYGNKASYLKSGSTEAQAQILGADAARSNTVNFARAGKYGRALNSVLPYLNAGIQGSRTLLRNLKDRPIQTGTKIVVVGFMPVATTTAWNISDPARKAAYDDISEYEKQGNIIIVPPNPHKDPKTGRWNVIKIPVSQEIANLNNVVRSGVEAAQKDTKINFAAMSGDLLGTATSLNTQNGRQLIGQVTPQAIKPGIESLVNQNLYSGNHLVPDSMKNLPGNLQVGPYTSGTAQVVGNLTKQSPIKIDNAISTSLGGLGQNIVHLSDTGLAKTGVIPASEIKGKSFSDAASQRFNSAQGKSPSTYANEAYKKASTELQSSAQFKGLSTDEKAKALNRLSTDAKAVEYRKYDAANNTGIYAPDYKGKQTTLSKNQIALSQGKLSPSDYAGIATSQSTNSGVKIADGINSADKQFLTNYNSLSADERKKNQTTQNDWDYKYAVAKYSNDLANKSLTDAQDIKAKAAIDKALVGKDYSKEVRDLYGLSKAHLKTYLNGRSDGDKLYAQLTAYDQALKDKAQITSLKFKNGLATSSGGSGRTSTAKGRAASYKSNLSTAIASAKSAASAAAGAKVHSSLRPRKIALNAPKRKLA